MLVPTKDRLAYLREAAESVLGQSMGDLELVVSDDGSSDGTLEYLQLLASRDRRVRVLLDNAVPGAFGNFAHLLANAQGDFISFLGDDDLLYPDYLRQLLDALCVSADPPVLAFCDHDIVDSHGVTDFVTGARHSAAYGRVDLQPGAVGGQIDDVVLGQTVPFGFMLVRREVAQAAGLRQDVGGVADFAFLADCAKRGSFSYVPRRLGAYRVHANTATRRGGRYMVDGLISVLSEYEPSTEHGRDLLRRRLATARLRQIQVAVRDDVPKAFQLSRDVLRQRDARGASLIGPWVRGLGRRAQERVGLRSRGGRRHEAQNITRR